MEATRMIAAMESVVTSMEFLKYTANLARCQASA